MCESKACTKCRKVKPFSSFGKDKSRKYGITSRCKECRKLDGKNKSSEWVSFYSLHKYKHLQSNIKYIKCEVCNSVHIVKSLSKKTKSKCSFCRGIKEPSVSYVNCLDCNELIISNGSKKRCRSCQAEYKKQQDREYKRAKRANPITNEIEKKRCRNYQYRKRQEKYLGAKTDINYSSCVSCNSVYIVNDKRKKYACPDCEDKLKPINITYKNCIDCGKLESIKLRGAFSWQRCDDCTNKRNRYLRNKYRQSEAYKEYRRKYKKENGFSNHRQRAKYYGVYYEPVIKKKIFKRDRYRCFVCGCKCNNINNDPKQATLGHIIPLSIGGAHSYSNVRTECRSCNIDRGINCDGEQITLFSSL